MKKTISLAFVSWLLISFAAQSQTKKSNQIFKIDDANTCNIDDISETAILYKIASNPKEDILSIAKSDVLKIVFSDGSIEDTNIPPQKVNEQNKANKYKHLSDQPRLVINVGGSCNYVLEPLSQRWVATNDSAAILLGFGGSLRVDLHLTKAIALSATIGINQWQVQRNYTNIDPVTKNKLIQYSSLDKFQLIPIQIGFKLYLVKGFYIHPQGSFNIISSKLTNKDEYILNPYGNGTNTTSLSKIGYGASIGCEIYKLPFVVDMSAFIQVVNSKNYKGIEEPLYYTGLRLGIGFGK